MLKICDIFLPFSPQTFISKTPIHRLLSIKPAVMEKVILPIIMENLNCSENEALKRFYESHIGECFADDSTGLYGQSARYVAGLFLENSTA